MGIISKLFRRKQVGGGKNKSEILIEYIRSCGGKVGEDVVLWDCVIDSVSPYMIEIGDHVTLTGARILTHDASAYRHLGYTKIGKVEIGSNVFVGKQAIIMPNTVIGDNVIIGAGAVIAKNIPSNSVVVGNPCKIICTYDEYMEKIKKQMEQYPVLDKYSDEILSDEYDKAVLVNARIGFSK